MGFHNINEDIVVAKVNAIFDFIEKNGNPEKICSCTQCRTDVTCYVLNRIEPHYIVSNRGIARVEVDSLTGLQTKADIVALVYDGIRRINNRVRPFWGHHTGEDHNPVVLHNPVFHIPIISGRLFNGLNFAPMEGVFIELYHGNNLVPMVDHNWQNPYTLVSQTVGVFTFWPNPLLAEGADIQKSIGFCIKVEKTGFEVLEHCFEISVMSEMHRISTFFMERILRLPDMYMFPAEA
ncbi:MAG: late competence development ComFB family protein [Treponema sp.]|jgi:competence protein ComFB|nr:late competence development ComFB family protein [Treponema sp.]